jgi:glycosyltransferase involved in cell wall biosynthesis
LLIVASTFPRRPGDGTPAFVASLAAQQAQTFDTLVLVPRVRGAPRREQRAYRIERFAYFPRRWERLADGAILENVRIEPWLRLQIPFFLLAEAVAIRRAIRVFDPDVLHLHWLVPQGVAALVGGRSRPWVVTTHGGDLYGLRGRGWAALERAVIKRASAATAVNADMTRRLSRLGNPPAGIHTLPMGVDADAVRAACAGVAAVPGRLMFAGRLVEKKGVQVLLEALTRLPADLEWSLDVVGDGPMRATLEAEATAHGMPVTFHGQIPQLELAAQWGRCQIAVLPSVAATTGDQDGLPVTLLEAMAAGKPAVASAIPGITEAVEDDINGVLVPPGDADALATALTDLLTDPERRVRIGQAAQLRAEDFLVDTIGKRYVELLLGQIESERRP